MLEKWLRERKPEGESTWVMTLQRPNELLKTQELQDPVNVTLIGAAYAMCIGH